MGDVLIGELTDCFKLHDYLVIAHKIGSETLRQYFPFISHIYNFFSFKRDTSQSKFFFKCFLINGLSETTTDMFVHFYCCTNQMKRFITENNLITHGTTFYQPIPV